jgi:uncharacterized protein with HEPN domain
MPRTYEDYLADIVKAIEAIEVNIKGLTFETFTADDNRVKAVLLDLAVIGEACHHIPDDVRANAPDVEWHKIVGLRNVIVHGYWLVNHRIIWQTARTSVPQLREQMKPLLDELSS